MDILTRTSYRIKPDDQVFCLQCQSRLWPRDRVYPLGPDSFCSPRCRQAFEDALETLAESDEIETTMAGNLACRLASVALLAVCLAGCYVPVDIRVNTSAEETIRQTEEAQPQPAPRRTPWDRPS